MTEEEWLVGDDVVGMVQHLCGTKVNERKFRLFALECVRGVRSHLQDQSSIRAIEFVEENAEKPFKGLRNRRQVHSAAMMAVSTLREVQQDAAPFSEHARGMQAAAIAASMLLDEAWIAALHCSHQTANVTFYRDLELSDSSREPSQPSHAERTRVREFHLHANWLRDIFGNPFRPVTFDPAWRTSTAVALAQQMYESHDFAAMPILADALQDAGCESPDVLSHCRGGGVHVRGCWVIDHVLAKS